MQRNFKNKAVAINELASNPVTMDDARKAFKAGFETGLDIHLEPYELSEKELEFVNELAETKYASDQWNYKR